MGITKSPTTVSVPLFRGDRFAGPRILPFGDSITYGIGSTDGGGYRSAMQTLAAADGKQLWFVGSLSAGPTTVSNVPFNNSNEGHAGWTIADNPEGYPNGITKLVVPTVAPLQPDIVLLMIGINDTNYTAGLPTLLDRLDTLLGLLAINCPAATIVVAQNTPANAALPPEWTTYINGIPGLVAARVARGQKFLTVNFQPPALTLADLSDAVHPNDSGYAKMAAIWYPVVKPFLP